MKELKVIWQFKADQRGVFLCWLSDVSKKGEIAMKKDSVKLLVLVGLAGLTVAVCVVVAILYLADNAKPHLISSEGGIELWDKDPDDTPLESMTIVTVTKDGGTKLTFWPEGISLPLQQLCPKDSNPTTIATTDMKLSESDDLVDFSIVSNKELSGFPPRLKYVPPAEPDLPSADDRPKGITLTGVDSAGDPLSFLVGSYNPELSGCLPKIQYTKPSDPEVVRMTLELFCPKAAAELSTDGAPEIIYEYSPYTYFSGDVFMFKVNDVSHEFAAKMAFSSS